ncbi:MAG: glycosyltransferase family 2 protein [Candidatus Aminicenantes bacterium]|jgi:glycosyltransferase involved in cell wall biosynthesis
MSEGDSLDLSLVIPVYNEAENLPILYGEIVESCQKLRKSYEIIFIDDGSWDESYMVLKRIQKDNPRVKIIKLRKNFGQTASLSAGFDHARGDIVITLDADLQNDPGDFPLFIRKIEEGFDIVSGWRKRRKDKFFSRRLPSRIANWLISCITRVKLHDYGCTLKAFRKEIIKNIKLYGELHRFIPAIASNMGVSIAEVQVNHRPRRFGKSKYSVFRFIRVILDLLTVKFLLSYSTRPLQIFGFFGLISVLAGGIIGLILSYQRLFRNQGLADRPLLLLAILLVVIGIQFITLGLLAEIMVRAYHESIEKSTYIIQEIIESDSEKN